MYELKFNKIFLRIFKKYFKKNQKLSKSLTKTLEKIRKDPFDISLKTHKVDTIRNKDIYSSSITADWRLGWIFEEKTNNPIIICLEMGTHSSSTQIYNKKSN